MTAIRTILALLVLLSGGSARSELTVSDKDRAHWAYLPLKQVSVAAGKSAHPVDTFLMAKLAEKGIAPTPRAEDRTLVRRIYFDLLGLPPTPAEVDEFVKAPDVAKLVDRLMASPHYGERWARHWLDVARYADSNGQEGDQDRPTAYHYRDFVIRAFNDDLPFNTFLRWQLAGDEFEPNNPLAIAATGFIVAGPHTVLDVPMEEEKIRNRFNELDDMIATTGSAMLGLTIGCARCHDHKSDAIPTRDYYRLMTAFNSGNRAEVPLAPLAEAREYLAAQTKWKTDMAAATNSLQKFVKRMEAQEAVTMAERREWDALEDAVKAVEQRKPKSPPMALAFADFAAKPRETFLLHRGDFQVKKEPVELGFLTVLTSSRQSADYWQQARNDQKRDDSTQQRRALAEWITDTESVAGALAARVIVNRVWQHHFGEGLVRTVNDFGVQGERPSHPELLEWLAYEFVKSGWRVKALHRLLMTSAAYLQDTTYDAQKAAADPDNRLLWRRRPQRLEAEILRDAMLSVSGTLNAQMHGPAFKAPIAAEAIQARNLKDGYPKNVKDAPENRRRTVYMFHKRVVQHPLMQAFDGPTAAASCGRRDSTTVAPQALALLNDRFVRARAEDFARRIATEPKPVETAWELALGRAPSATELVAANDFLKQQQKRRSRSESLSDLCQAIFAMNEFIYVD